METQGNELVKFDPLKADITLFTQPIFALTVTDDESAAVALDTARQVKAFTKKAEELRASLVGPLNERVKKVNAYAKGLTEPLLQAERHLKTHLAKWEQHLEQIRIKKLKEAEEERRRQEAEIAAKLKAEQDAAEMESLFKSSEDVKRDEIVRGVEQERVQTEIQQQHRATVSELNTMKVSGARKVWSFKVADVTAVPIEFLVVDESAVRKAINAGAREIPGIEIFQETKVTIR